MKKFLRSLLLLCIFLGAFKSLSAQTIDPPVVASKVIDWDTAFYVNFTPWMDNVYVVVEWSKTPQFNTILKRDSLFYVYRSTYSEFPFLQPDSWYYIKATAHTFGSSIKSVSYDSVYAVRGISQAFPSYDARNVILTPTLRWKKSPYAVDYTVYIYSKRDIATTIFTSAPTKDTSFFVPAGVLSNNVTYYWTLGANNFHGVFTKEESFRFASGFTTIFYPTPAKPTLTTQNNTVFTEGNPPVLAWAAVSGASSYCVEISTTSDFSNNTKKYCDITGASFTVPSAKTVNARLEETTIAYYWRVASVNASGQGLWSASNTYYAGFTTGTESTGLLASSLLSYPNPFQDVLFIAYPNLKKAEITDMKGNLLLVSKESSIPTSTLATGLYLLKIETNDGTVVHQKIVKQ